jgi:hypothetical protein
MWGWCWTKMTVNLGKHRTIVRGGLLIYVYKDPTCISFFIGWSVGLIAKVVWAKGRGNFGISKG